MGEKSLFWEVLAYVDWIFLRIKFNTCNVRRFGLGEVSTPRKRWELAPLSRAMEYSFQRCVVDWDVSMILAVLHEVKLYLMTRSSRLEDPNT